MPRAAMRTIVVTGARPLVGPDTLAADRPIKIQIQCHASLLSSQTIIPARNKVDKSTIPQILKLLANLRLDVLVAGIAVTQMPLESVNLVEREFALPERLHAFHDIKQPATAVQRFISEEKRLLPFCQDEVFLSHDAVLDNMNFPGFRDLAEQNVRTYPARTSGGCGQRLSLFDDLADEEVFWDDEQIHDR